MPRKGRGGRVAVTPGTPLPNRDDLAVAAAPNQEYGAAGAQRAAQRAVPMAAAPPGTPTPHAAAPAEPPLPAPGTLPFLDATNRPQEPVTAGLSVGPGPGPEAMPVTQPTAAAQLARMAQGPNSSPTLQRLAQIAAQLGV